MAARFTPPPSWPPVPDGWTPPPGWQPDPSWPPAPPGWNFYPDAAPGAPAPGIPVGGSRITLGHPSQAFIYEACTPQVSLDGSLVARGWGTHPLPVTPVDATLQVHVPYLGTKAGRASVVLPAGQGVELRYEAPSVVFLRGAIAGGGEKPRSPGYRGVMTLNWIAIGVAAIAVAVVVTMLLTG
ncbi:hypothetical protein [Cellulomonas cellasea]|uniref:Uncharacterized protein n=1 Tax=Cellulomonas cellasea TaxID=43670 RepID=A0A7W4UHC7_9CELL|nr:hypothetical protein [Cellulomonas cellasea]MBB2923705.1 hypothetical protein [Cellulomonas cellasea]